MNGKKTFIFTKKRQKVKKEEKNKAGAYNFMCSKCVNFWILYHGQKTKKIATRCMARLFW